MCCAACVARKPIVLHMVWVLLAHEWITDFMWASPDYLTELQDSLYHVWKAVCLPKPLQLKLLTAACWLKARKANGLPDCRDAVATHMGASCLQSMYRLVGAASTIQVHVHKTCSKALCMSTCQITSVYPRRETSDHIGELQSAWLQDAS